MRKKTIPWFLGLGLGAFLLCFGDGRGGLSGATGLALADESTINTGGTDTPSSPEGEIQPPAATGSISTSRGPSTLAGPALPQESFSIQRPKTTADPLPGEIKHSPVRPIESEIIYSNPPTSESRTLPPDQLEQVGREMSGIGYQVPPETPVKGAPPAPDAAPLSEIYQTPRTPAQRNAAFNGARDRGANLVDPHGLTAEDLATAKEQAGLGDLPENLKTGEDNLRSALDSENQKRMIDAVRRVGGNSRAVDQLNQLNPESITLRKQYVTVKDGITKTTARNLQERLAKTYGVSPEDVQVFTTSTKKAPLAQTGDAPLAGHDTDFGAKVKGIEVDHNTLRKHLAPAYGDAVLEKNMDAAGLARDNIKAMSRLSPERITDLAVLRDPKVQLEYPHATGEDFGNKVYTELAKSRLSANAGNFTGSESQKLDAYQELNKIGKITRNRFPTGNAKLSEKTRKSLELVDEMLNPKYPGERPATPREIDEALAKRGESIDSLTNKVISNVQGSEVLKPPGQQVSDKLRMDSFVERVKGKLALNRLKDTTMAAQDGKFEPVDSSRGHADTRTGYEDLRKTWGKQSFQGEPSPAAKKLKVGHADTTTGYEDLSQRPVDKKTGLRGKSSVRREITVKKVLSQAMTSTMVSGIAGKAMTDELGRSIDEGKEASVGGMALETAKGLAVIPGLMEQERRNLADEYRKVVAGKQTENEARWNALRKTADDMLLKPGREVAGRNLDEMYAKAKAEGRAKPEMLKDGIPMFVQTTRELIGKYSGMETLGEAFQDTATFDERGELAGQKKYMDQFAASRLTQSKVKRNNLLKELEKTLQTGSAGNPETGRRVQDILNRYDQEYKDLQNLNRMVKASKGKIDPKQVKRIEQELDYALDPKAMSSHAEYMAGEKGVILPKAGGDTKAKKASGIKEDAKEKGETGEDRQQRTDKQGEKVAAREVNPFDGEKGKMWLSMMNNRESQRSAAGNERRNYDIQARTTTGTSSSESRKMMEEVDAVFETVTAPTGCSKDRDCPNGYNCRNRQCVPAACGRNSDCPQGYMCRDGECVGVRPGETPEVCSKNNDCPEGFACRDSRCVESRPEEDKTPSGCGRNSDCPEGYTCRDGQCEALRPDKAPSACSSNSQCPEEYACRDGQCVPLRPDKKPNGCSRNSDCPKDYICRDNRCVALKPDKVPGSCEKNSDCPEGYACRNNSCVQLRPDRPPGSCTKNSDCPEGYACRNNVCLKLKPDVEKPTGCSGDRDCPAGSLCINGECSLIGYYLSRSDLYLKINGTSCTTTVYSCAQITEKELALFARLARSLYEQSFGVIDSGGASEDQCVRTQELVNVRQTTIQGPSKTPISVPRPTTNCPCSDTAEARYMLNSEYDPNCTPYEQVKEALRLLSNQ